MGDRTRPNRRGDGQLPASPDAGAVAAVLAGYGMVALLPIEESVATGDQVPDRSPETALRIRLSAQKVWSEGRANPLDWVCRSWVGDWQTADRVTWRTTDGIWLAQLQRSPNGRRVFLYVWCNQTLVGYQDDTSWHPAPARSRSRQPRPEQRSLPLPLPLAV